MLQILRPDHFKHHVHINAVANISSDFLSFVNTHELLPRGPKWWPAHPSRDATCQSSVLVIRSCHDRPLRSAVDTLISRPLIPWPAFLCPLVHPADLSTAFSRSRYMHHIKHLSARHPPYPQATEPDMCSPPELLWVYTPIRCPPACLFSHACPAVGCSFRHSPPDLETCPPPAQTPACRTTEGKPYPLSTPLFRHRRQIAQRAV